MPFLFFHKQRRNILLQRLDPTVLPHSLLLEQVRKTSQSINMAALQYVQRIGEALRIGNASCVGGHTILKEQSQKISGELNSFWRGCATSP